MYVNIEVGWWGRGEEGKFVLARFTHNEIIAPPESMQMHLPAHRLQSF